MVLHPVGPLPASTYWRRRLVLLTALVVALLVLRSCTADSPRPASSPRTAHTVAPSRKPSPTPSPSPRTTATAPSGPVTCSDRVLTLATSTPAPSAPVGSTVRFTLRVTNTGSVPCRRDLGGGALEVVVYSGKDRIWSSDDCGSDTSVSVQTLPAGGSLETNVSWAGKRSARGCPTGRPKVQPGTYTARARVGSLHASPAVFRLTG